MTDPTTNPGGTSTGGGVDPNAPRTEEQARTELDRAADEAQSRGQAIAEEARSEAARLAGQAQSAAEAKAEEYKGQAAGEMNRMATALRDAGSDLREGTPQERAISSMADNLADAADAVANRDLGSLMGDAAAFARRNPSAFLGGAALLGFAAARFAKASARNPTSSYGSSYGGASYGSRPYGAYEPDYGAPLPATTPAATGPTHAAATGSTGGMSTTAGTPYTATPPSPGSGSATSPTGAPSSPAVHTPEND